ncbi:DUF6318 family protein [Nocardioides acrostichi]|uniref:DUF6318 domain-containing protein n=1 Tax=Nocardioides acrostichi TaxID=2784339 RepID=A0A930Y7Y9_9ACTN|nr:DUF6318 family protein [Nocardioides acrostichi]MBF4162547.1 hypothetical protein [Nocardioides acrostichi]
MLRTRRLATPLAAALLIAALGACGGDPEPKFEPTESTSPTPSDDTTTDAADVKEPWEKKTPQGAMAFTQHWVDEFNQASRTGKTGDLKQLNDAACTSCKTLTDIIDGVYGQGGNVKSDPWQFTDSSVGVIDRSGPRLSVTGTMTIPKQRVDDGLGETKTFAAAKRTYYFDVAWERGSWTVLEVSKK